MAIKISGSDISLAVRDLTALNPETSVTLTTFPLPQRGMLGREAQVKVQKHRAEKFGLFHSEYTINGEIQFGGYDFTIQGRIDSVFQLKDRIEIEEIKSVILNAAEFNKLQIEKYPQFTEQVLFYSYLMQREWQGIEIWPYLTLINLVNDKQRNFPVAFSPLSVENLLFIRLQQIIDKVRADNKIQDRRRQVVEKLDLRLPEDRPQQKEMMAAVSDSLHEERNLLVSAPTGTGKTAGALFPALRFALTNAKRVFFCTSKNTQQEIVYHTLKPALRKDTELSVIFLRSVRKMCINDVFFCHEDFCPYAKNYRERLLDSNIISELLEEQLILPELISERAKKIRLCPAEVMLDLAVHTDIVIGDYNYVFDPAVYLRRLFNQKDYSDWILIIDEAHNLYQRGLGYFSPQITHKEVADLYEMSRHKQIRIYKQLSEDLSAILAMFKSMMEDAVAWYPDQQFCPVSPDRHAWEKHYMDYEADFIKYLIHKVKKKILLPDDPFETFYYRLRRFIQVLRMEENIFRPFLSAGASGALNIQCCDPAGPLGNRLGGFHTVIAMSATLDPVNYYQTVLGFPGDNTSQLVLDSPFPPENRQMIIIPSVSTKYSKRSDAYPEYARIIINIVHQKKGNYLIFFPSFEFMQNVNLFLGSLKYHKLIQQRFMSDADRDHTLDQLREKKSANVLLAVMGGIFSEGVDYTGDMCIGVIIFSPGLPQVNYARELIRDYYETKNGDGFAYAYLYPGVNKVIQSAGRLIRSHQDKGIVALVGERFAEEQISSLLPQYWFQGPDNPIITKNYIGAVKKFWARFRR